MRVRVPRGQLVAISADLQRAAMRLAELEKRLSRAIGLLQEAPQAGREPRLVASEEELLQAYTQGRQLADQAELLAGVLRDTVDILDTTDRRAASRVPTVPRLIGALPILRPEPRPWPYAAVPPITMLPGGRRNPDDLAPPGTVDGGPDGDSLPGGQA
jgi:hypothetical protein